MLQLLTGMHCEDDYEAKSQVSLGQRLLEGISCRPGLCGKLEQSIGTRGPSSTRRAIIHTAGLLPQLTGSEIIRKVQLSIFSYDFLATSYACVLCPCSRAYGTASIQPIRCPG